MGNERLVVAITVLVLAAPAYSQPAGKEGTPKDLLAVVEALRGKSTTPRHQAYLRLMSNRPLPKEVAQALSKIVASETGEPRTLAAALLAEITPKDTALVAPLSEGLATKDSATIIAALKGLDRLGPLAKSALPSVLVAMESTNPSIRSAAVPAAASAGKDAIAPLEKIIHKAGESRKRNDHAAMALGKIGLDATPAILKLFDRDDPEMDYHAAVALKSMDKKPAEALKPMLRLAEHKDYKVRRPVFDYLVAVTPPTGAIDEMLWKGIDDVDPLIAGKCRTAIRQRTTDKAKWASALKKTMERPSESGWLSTLHELYQFDPKLADQQMPSSMHAVLSYQFTSKWRLAMLATFEKELIPHLPAVYKYLDGPSTGAISGRLNAITLLTHLPPEHTKPVVAKLQGDLKAPRWELKLIAAQALLRTNPPDKVPIAKALAEVLTTADLADSSDEVLASLRGMGPDAAAAVPGLRIAQGKARSDVRAKMLLLMVALDPEQKPGVVAIAEKMRQDAKDPYAGAAVLLELGAISAEDALKTFAPAVEVMPPNPSALRAIQIVGPKVKALTPKLEAALGNPKNLYLTSTVMTLAKIDGNTKLALERLIQIARDDPKQFSNVAVACGRFGPDARPVVPEFLELRAEHRSAVDFPAALARIDPNALFRSAE